MIAQQPTQEQYDFINFEGEESVILKATAGSGKSKSFVDRLNKMLADGVNPDRIIFFSFTNDAVKELKTRINAPVRITTIHSYTSSQLGNMKKFKPIVTFYMFATWYKENYKPKPYDPIKKRMDYQNNLNKFYEDGNQISSLFSAYKLQTADTVKVAKPKFYDEYKKFLFDTFSRDFSDLLLETERLSKNPQYVHFFADTYDYVFIDEYQDTSTIQLKILLAIKAKQYYLAGDENQSIFSFSGANCDAIEQLLKQHKSVVKFTLSKNFRSKVALVEHSNTFSNLQAIPHSTENGILELPMIDEDTLFEMLKDDEPVAVLVRTNKVIKELEKKCLKKKIKMKYFNYFSPEDVEMIKEGGRKINPSIKKKLEAVSSYFGGDDKLIAFIEGNQNSESFITSIHKSKGREYSRVVVVNSFSPEQLMDTPDLWEDYSFINASGEEDIEARNVHYVACTRAKDEQYFLMYEE